MFSGIREEKIIEEKLYLSLNQLEVWLDDAMDQEWSFAPEKAESLRALFKLINIALQKLLCKGKAITDITNKEIIEAENEAKVDFNKAMVTAIPLVKPHLNLNTWFSFSKGGGVVTFISKLVGISRKDFLLNFIEILKNNSVDYLAKKLESLL